GYNSERVAKAQGEGERFNLIASEYKVAPEVTRKRLYIETMQQVLKESSKVIDYTGGKNVLYLPLNGSKGSGVPAVEAVTPALPTPESGKGSH
ncbi:MAG: FtsH protease activity modulator HflK, partial [Rhodanobacteraceae bacterium]